MSLLMGIGTSSDIDVFRAGEEAAEQMQVQLGERPQLTVVFAALRFADARLLQGVRSVTQGVPLIGCTDAGGISTWGPVRQAVIVIGFRGLGCSFVTGVARDVSKDPEAAGARLAQDLRAGEPGVIRSALIFPDGLARNGSALLRGLQKGLPSGIPIAGGSAGDDFHFQKTFQFFDEAVLTDSVPGALICGDVAVGIGVRHGWVPLGRPCQVTKADGEIIQELDGKPAVAMYELYTGVKRGSLALKPLVHITMTYPLGEVQAGDGESLMRAAIGIGENGSLICSGEFREGSWVRLMIAGHDSMLAAAAQAAQQAAHALGHNRFKGALVFAGGGRQRMLGRESQGEIDVIRDSLGGVGVRLGGFYGYGEQAPWAGKSTFHNESVVVMALG